MWAEEEHGIPTKDYFLTTESIKIWLLHICGTVLLLIPAFIGFLRYPTVFTCSSNFICDCIDQPQYTKWYSEICNATENATSTIPISNATTAVNLTAYLETNSAFDAVDTASILLSVASFIGIGAVLFLSAAIARYRKKGKAAERLQSKMRMVRQKFSVKTQELVEASMAAYCESTDTSIAPIVPYRVPREHVVMIRCIGKGAASEVWFGSCNGMDAAIKCMFINGEDDINAIEMYKKECLVMARLQQSGGIAHPNIIQMNHCCWQGELLLLLEYCPLGSLDDLIVAALNGNDAFVQGLQWKTSGKEMGHLSTLVLDACTGLRFMHDQNPPIIHRDLKTSNVLVSGTDDPSTWMAKIADFGCARDLKDANEEIQLMGTPYFVAPEVIVMGSYDETSDIYSFGMLLLDVAAWESGGLSGLWGDSFSMVKITQGDRPILPKALTTPPLIGLGNLIKACWEPNPSSRPRSFREVEERLANALV